MNLPMLIFVAVLAAVVLWRVGAVAVRFSPARFGCRLRAQGFAVGHGALALGAVLAVIDAWRGAITPAAAALLAASVLLMLFDRRRRER